ncbi:hydrophobe/amphiphile efflux-1 family RND transporter [Pleomorphomonas diazotrophica]|uniref:Efflux pump membrane transporter n=1 Tax=Pleomorphomonas diazotrophica TaxID=1166257 RepID=A0A1I4WPR8_9HYPH|nr:efflux RND transporter permease subunit [Pleomorphomonas diazotrophica]PKR87284.1 hydrophobe/amphiphile efflux-1 family RND transporter [Pleomorphomonas diazotrophica]SFN15864.1 multidrug efflux pump [Pleomorphomonas diazotrophica]
MAQFFINRPVFAWVIAITIMLAGILAISTLSISQYPEIAPPTVRVSATYPGASAETVENAVTKVIEQNMNGLDNLEYMESSSTSDGSSSITLTFSNGTDADIAQMQTQNKLQLVESLLPDAVIDQGITVTKSTSSFLMAVGLVSTDGKLTGTDLADVVSTRIEDQLRRVDGVGDLMTFGGGYAMRIWLDPNKLNKYALTPSDVAAAVRAQNTQVSAGQIGGRPLAQGAQLNATITAQSQLQTPEQFRNIILKTQQDGSIVRLGDVARVEIGAESYAADAYYNGKPAAGFGINLSSGANALQTAENVRTTLDRLKPSLPQNVEYVYAYDTTPFVQLSIEKVVETLIEAVVLVFLVMYLFLQNLRATLIPVIAVPVVLLGTFGVLAVMGYSINTLTMFAMVLAIGLLVDDAIVVVENVERIMTEEKLHPKAATQKSMREITSALIGIALVLSAVFVPMAFMGGSTGIIYRQFSVTIVSAMLLSVIVALVLTPALCATMLKPSHGGHRGFFGWFNRRFDDSSSLFQRTVRGIVGRPVRMMVVFLALVGGAAFMFDKLPSSFIPEEDQGVLLAMIQLPTGATMERTKQVTDQMTDYFLKNEPDAVEAVMGITGFSFAGSGQNAGLAFIRLKDFKERTDPRLSAQAVVGRAMGALSQIKDAMIFTLLPPAMPGLGISGGFDMYLQDNAGTGRAALEAARDQLLMQANQNPKLMAVRENAQANQMQLHVNIDQEKATALGISLADINSIITTAWAGSYVNDFIDRGEIKPVYLQGDAPFRMTPDDFKSWYARNGSGEMVPFSSFVETNWSFGAPKLSRFNGVSAVNIQGSANAAAGVSSGEAMAEMENLVAKQGGGYTAGWIGLSYQELLSGAQANMLYAVSFLVVFLCLAALYESWTIPFAVMLSVPISVLGTLLAAKLFGQSNDVYLKVGLLTTIGLAAKNAILIVEFARDLQRQGEGLIEAALHAARIRLRPIIMTSLAFILGVTPLAIATGAGSAAQNAIGIGVMGGMIASVTVGLFFVPLLFYIVMRSSERLGWNNRPPEDQAAAEI